MNVFFVFVVVLFGFEVVSVVLTLAFVSVAAVAFLKREFFKMNA